MSHLIQINEKMLDPFATPAHGRELVHRLSAIGWPVEYTDDTAVQFFADEVAYNRFEIDFERVKGEMIGAYYNWRVQIGNLL